jgi:hypothetical protein
MILADTLTIRAACVTRRTAISLPDGDTNPRTGPSEALRARVRQFARAYSRSWLLERQA